MDSKKKGLIIGVIGIIAAIAAVAGAFPISNGFGFDATAWYVIASTQIVSAIVAVSYLYSTDRDEKRDD